MMPVSAEKRRLEIRRGDGAVDQSQSQRSHNARVVTEESADVNVIFAALRNVRVVAIEMGVENHVMHRSRVVLVHIVDGVVSMDHGPGDAHGDDRQHQQ